MPPANQSAQASSDSINAFLSLSEEQQRAALDRMSDPAKQALLAGIQAQSHGPGRGGMPTPPTTPSPVPPDSVLGGFARRAVDTGKSLLESFGPPQTTAERLSPLPIPVTRMAEGAIQGEGEAAKQTVSQLGDMARDIRAGDIRGAAGDYLRAGTTSASMLDPFATGTVIDVNRLEDQGRQREALGTAAFDTLTLLLGSAFGREPSERTRLAKLTGAVGDTEETPTNLRATLPDIAQTAQMTKPPATVGDFRANVQTTLTRLDDQFNQAFFPIRGNLVMPTEVSNRIMSLITPDMAKTAEGREAASYIRKRALEYQRPWTLNELNAKRMTENANLDAFYNKGESKQTAALRSNEDVAISKAIRDGSAKIVYDEVGRANPGLDAQSLKRRQSALIELKNQLNSRVKQLEAKQLSHEGRTLGEKLHPSTYIGSSGKPHGYVRGIQEAIPGGGPEKYGNVKVRQAFGPTAGATARRAAVLSLPLSHLAISKGKGLPEAPSTPASSNVYTF